MEREFRVNLLKRLLVHWVALASLVRSLTWTEVRLPWLRDCTRVVCNFTCMHVSLKLFASLYVAKSDNLNAVCVKKFHFREYGNWPCFFFLFLCRPFRGEYSSAAALFYAASKPLLKAGGGLCLFWHSNTMATNKHITPPPFWESTTNMQQRKNLLIMCNPLVLPSMSRLR